MGKISSPPSSNFTEERIVGRILSGIARNSTPYVRVNGKKCSLNFIHHAPPTKPTFVLYKPTRNVKQLFPKTKHTFGTQTSSEEDITIRTPFIQKIRTHIILEKDDIEDFDQHYGRAERKKKRRHKPRLKHETKKKHAVQQDISSPLTSLPHDILEKALPTKNEPERDEPPHFLTPTGADTFYDSPCIIVNNDRQASDDEAASVGAQTSPLDPFLVTPPERRRLIKDLANQNIAKSKVIEDLTLTMHHQRETIRKLNQHVVRISAGRFVM